MKYFACVVLLIGLVLSTGCKLEPQIKNRLETDRIDMEEISKGAVTDAPGFRDYVGNGYDLLGDDITFQGRVLNKTYPDSIVFEYEGITDYNGLLIEDYSDLDQLNYLEAGGSVSGAFGPLQIEGSAKYSCSNHLSTTNKSISLISMARYKYGKVTLNHTAFIGNFLTMLRDDKNGFYRNFGNGYSRTTELGGYLFSLFTFTLKQNSEKKYEDLKAEVNARLAGLFEIKGTIDIESLYALASKHVEVSSTLFAIGYIPNTIPQTNEEMRAEIGNFQDAMTKTFNNDSIKYDNPATCLNLPCLGTIYESYEDLARRQDNANAYSCDIDDYYNWKIAWWKYYGKLDRVKKDLELNTFNLPVDVITAILPDEKAAIENVKAEMEKCINRDSSACEPPSGIYDNLINFFRIELEAPAVFTVVNQGEPVRLCWNNDMGLTSFRLLVNRNIEPAEPITARVYDYLPAVPGVVTWSVLGYRNNGVPVDSGERSFIVPGFDLPSSRLPAGPVTPGTTIRFYIINQFPNQTHMTNVLYIQKGSEPAQEIPFPDGTTTLSYKFEVPDTSYTVWVEGACNGTTGKSEALTIITLPVVTPTPTPPQTPTLDVTPYSVCYEYNTNSSVCGSSVNPPINKCYSLMVGQSVSIADPPDYYISVCMRGQFRYTFKSWAIKYGDVEIIRNQNRTTTIRLRSSGKAGITATYTSR